jgi:hypothetical protein
MSLSGDSRAEFCPEGIDLLSQLGRASGVVHDHVSRTPAIFPTGLGGNPGLGFSASESIAHHQPLDLSFIISVHGDDNIEVLMLAGLDQQWDHVHHDCRVAGSLLQLGGSSPYGRVHNSLEITARVRISEDDLGKPRPVDLSVSEYLRTKAVDDRSKRRSAWLDHLAGQYIGVNDDRTACRKLVGHHALPRRDAAGQTYPHHGPSPPASVGMREQDTNCSLFGRRSLITRAIPTCNHEATRGEEQRVVAFAAYTILGIGGVGRGLLEWS